MTTSVLLRLEGPLQSWGTRSRFSERDTEAEPSKSGVIGLVGAALGMARSDRDLLSRLAAASMAVRVDREGSLLRDFHTVGGGRFRGLEHSVFDAKDTVLTTRHYLQSASFLVALGYDDAALARRIDTALAAPCWPLALGRRACVPSLPVRAGIVEKDPEAALRAVIWPGHTPPEHRIRLVIECRATEADASARQDQPLSFALHERHYSRRFVRTLFIEPAELNLTSKDVPCISLAAC